MTKKFADLHSLLINQWLYRLRQIFYKAKIALRRKHFLVFTIDQLELFQSGLIVKGWAITDSEIDIISVSLNNTFLGNAIYGNERCDVERRYPNVHNNRYCGFTLVIPIYFQCPVLSENVVSICASNSYGQSLQQDIRISSQESGQFFLNASDSQRFKMFSEAPSTKDSTCVILDHMIGGGANCYRIQYIEQRLRENAPVLLVMPSHSHNMIYTCTYYSPRETFQAPESFQLLCLEHLEIVLDCYGYSHIQVITINNLVGYPDPLQALSVITRIHRATQGHVIIPIHEYFSICPSFNLLNDRGGYCKIPAIDECNRCIVNNPFRPPAFRNDTISHWREVWGELLNQADCILCFSQSSLGILTSVYPSLDRKRIHIIPHTVDYVQVIGTIERDPQAFRIGIIGNINIPKGSRIIESIVHLLEEQSLTNIKIILIGQLFNLTIKSHYFLETGAYDRAELSDLIKRHHIDIVFIPSICPETFSYATEEAIHMNLPVAVFDLGAPAERVRAYSKGLIIEEPDANLALEKMLRWFNSVHSMKHISPTFLAEKR